MQRGLELQSVRNAHLICIFKRILYLLEHNIKPVFVFDGKAPELKRHTLRLRQDMREKRLVNLKKLAEIYIVRELERKAKQFGY
jgi:DNA excision repair protein ERCC-5